MASRRHAGVEVKNCVVSMVSNTSEEPKAALSKDATAKFDKTAAINPGNGKCNTLHVGSKLQEVALCESPLRGTGGQCTKRASSSAAAVTRRSKRHKNTGPQGILSSNSVSHLVSGGKVALLMGQRKVGNAICHMPPDGSAPFSRSLHGKDLKDVEKVSQFLITIKTVEIFESYAELEYPYDTPGQEDAPKLLSDIFRAGMYVWDAKELQNLEKV